MAPLGVKVVTVVTGSVDTNIHVNSPKPELPPTSRYLPAKTGVDKMYEDKVRAKKTTPDQFAKEVVGDVLGGVVGKVWRGPYAGTTRWASHVMPMWLQVSFLRLSDETGLTRSLQDRILNEGTDLDKLGVKAP